MSCEELVELVTAYRKERSEPRCAGRFEPTWRSARAASAISIRCARRCDCRAASPGSSRRRRASRSGPPSASGGARRTVERVKTFTRISP